MSKDLERRKAAMGITPELEERMRRSLAAGQRRATGAEFESELSQIHRVYEWQRWGRIRRQHAPTAKIKGKWIRTGSAAVDYAGHVSVRVVAGQPNGFALEGCQMAQSGRVYPVAFDAKVMKATHSTYHHDVEQQHQLHELRDEASVGVYAFLLILAPAVERIFLLPIANHFNALIAGAGVQLWERRARGGSPADVFPLVPSIGRGAAGPVSGLWHWLPLLQWCAGGYD